MSETTIPQPAATPRRLPVSPTSIALALASPAVAGCMLALARHWSDHGARHSIGDMVPLGLGAIIGLAVTAWASVTEDAVLVGTCGSLTAAAIGIGMMAYPTGLAEPLIVTVAATVTGWILTRRHARARTIRREQHAERDRDRTHEANIVGMRVEGAVQVAAITAAATVDREKVRWLGAYKVAEINAQAAEFEAWQLETADRRRQALTISTTAAAALAGPTRAAIEPADDMDALAESVLGDLDPQARRSA